MDLASTTAIGKVAPLPQEIIRALYPSDFDSARRFGRCRLQPQNVGVVVYGHTRRRSLSITTTHARLSASAATGSSRSETACGCVWIASTASRRNFNSRWSSRRRVAATTATEGSLKRLKTDVPSSKVLIDG